MLPTILSRLACGVVFFAIVGRASITASTIKAAAPPVGAAAAGATAAASR